MVKTNAKGRAWRAWSEPGGAFRRGEAPIRHGRVAPVSPLSGVVKFIAAAVCVVLVSAVAVVGIGIAGTISAIKPGIHLASLPGLSDTTVPSVGAIEGPVNLLLTGTDTRTGQGGSFGTANELAGSSGAGSNDVTMVLHIAADHKSAVVVSIPRDLLVSIPQCTNGKRISPAVNMQMFNTTLSRGGLSCVVLTAEKLTGLNIPYAAEVSFDGVIAMSNAIGGVTVCLATPVVDRYSGLNLAAGQQTVVGAEALAFLRSRHGVGNGSDLGRISNQQLFLSALTRKVSSAGLLDNPVTLFSLANAAVSNMQLSDTLARPVTLMSIATALRDMGLKNIVFVQYPTRSDSANRNRVVPDAASASILDAALIADQQIQLTGTVGGATEVDPTATSTAALGTTSSTSSTPPATLPPVAATTVVTLPPSVTGQTAAEQTCTVGKR